MTMDYSMLTKVTDKPLYSLRNKVYLVRCCDTLYVHKLYKTEASFYTELNNLNQLSEAGLRVPEVLWAKYPSVITNYIEGITYLELLEKCQIDVCIVYELCNWLGSYYEATGALRKDVNLRNFLYHDGLCYGVDFEEQFIPGSPEKDMGSILAFTATYDPAFNKYKKDVCHMLFEGFIQMGAKKDKIIMSYHDEITAMLKRRGKRFPGNKEAAHRFARDFILNL